jgi:hypothetical protein
MRHLALLLPLALGCRTFINEGEQTERLAEFDRDGDGAYDADRGGDDCDDADPTALPGGTEVCDGVDNDCDGQIDEDLSADLWPDADGDGFGDAEAASERVCNGADGYAANNQDCDDANGQVKPGAAEQCNDLDDDCDGTVDNGFAQTWYADADTDGFGDPAATLSQCNPPSGYTDVGDDCDDTDPEVHPLAEEVCDGADNDCDGLTDADDDDISGLSVWYADTDGDGFGDAASEPVQGCEAPGEAWTDNAADCDDTNASTRPGAEDLCGDGLDNDCNGIPDDGAGLTWGVDGDGDGYGERGGLELVACDSPGAGWVPNVGDCDDGSPLVSPEAEERCNGNDDDCDGATDEEPSNTGWFVDSDGDGFGDPGAPAASCPPSSGPFAGHAPNATDCDDASAEVYPQAPESCADVGVDNDCDDDPTEEGIDPRPWYRDADADGFGLAADALLACAQPTGRVLEAGDCDDAQASVNPDADELCNSRDDDCDGLVDNGATDATPFYPDLDDDGFGSAGDPVNACARPPLRAPNSDDCDDADPQRRPGAAERCNELDDDCDGTVDEGSPPPATWYRDADNDGYGTPSTTQVACARPSGYVGAPGDCNDASAQINPGAAETCDAADRNCDGDAYAGATDTTTFYRDEDGDTWGRSSPTQAACVLPSGYAARQGDCLDTDAAVNPGGTERCNGKDDDCNGTIDGPASVDAGAWWPDRDGDTFGDSGASTRACAAPPAHVAGSGTADCDDTSAARFPGNPEVCDGVDNDCVGGVDLPAPASAPLWYRDADADNVGGATSQRACAKPTGFVASTGDCDDADPDRFPGNSALACDDVTDADCDGEVDNDADGDGLSSDACGGSDCNDADPTKGLTCSAIELPGLLVWLDGDEPRGAGVSVSDNAAINTWTNLANPSANAVVFYGNPYYKSGEYNGNGVVWTDNDAFQLANLSLPPHRTVILAGRVEEGGNNAPYPMAWRHNQADGMWWRSTSPSNKDLASGFGAEASTSVVSAEDDWYYLEMVSAPLGQTLRGLKLGSGGPWSNGSRLAVVSLAASNSGTLYLGGKENSANRRSNSRWLIVLVYDRALTTTELAAIRAELGARFNDNALSSGP